MEKKPSPKEPKDIHEVTLNGGVWLPSNSEDLRGSYIIQEISKIGEYTTHIEFQVSKTGIVTRIESSFDKEGNQIEIPRDISTSTRHGMAVNAQEIKLLNEKGEEVYSLKFNINPLLVADVVKYEDSLHHESMD